MAANGFEIIEMWDGCKMKTLHVVPGYDEAVRYIARLPEPTDPKHDYGIVDQRNGRCVSYSTEGY